MASGGRRSRLVRMGDGDGAGGEGGDKDDNGGVDKREGSDCGQDVNDGRGGDDAERQAGATSTSSDGKDGGEAEGSSRASSEGSDADAANARSEDGAKGAHGKMPTGSADSKTPQRDGTTAEHGADDEDDAGGEAMSDGEERDSSRTNERDEGEDGDHAMGEDGDEAKGKNADKRTAKQASEAKPKTLGELYVDLKAAFHQHPDSYAEEMGDMASDYFRQLFAAQASHGQQPKAGDMLPNLTTQQAQKLVELFRAQIVGRQGSAATVLNAIRDLVIACFRSTWAFDKLLHQRVSSAQVPAAPPNMAWGKPTSSGSSATAKTTMTDSSATFRFDPFVYSAEDIARLGKICCEPHAFPKTLRQRTADEWTIMWGIMNGTILARTHPQFMKRCCTMDQFQYFHHFMVERAEGELFVKLPGNMQMYDYNQTTARLSDLIRASANAQSWKDPRLAEMLAAVKVVSYNEERHAIHLHFFTKIEATKWENMAIPILRTTAVLQNPDARRREIVTREDGTQAVVLVPPPDGVEDDRYQSPYRCRITNITRTFEVDKLARFLQKLTGNGLRMGVPVDTYGQGSQWSLVWDFFALTANCPAALASVHRIMWRDHQLLVIHKLGINAAPCHKCARTGHQMANCTTPEEEWYTEHTLIVTDDDIAQLATERKTWTTPEEAQAIFDRLGQADTTSEQPAAPPTPIASEGEGTDAANAPEPQNEEVSNASKETPINEDTPPEPAAAAAWKTMWSKKRHGKAGRSSDGKKGAADQQPETGSKTDDSKTKPQKSGTTSKKKGKGHTPKERSDDKGGAAGERQDAGSAPPLQTKEDEEMKDAQDDDDATQTDTKSVIDLTGDGEPTKDASERPGQRPHGKTAAEALEEAIALANMERLQMETIKAIKRIRKPVQHEAIIAAINKALQHVEKKTSVAWLLEALNGQLTATPGNGNCQAYSVVEAMTQQRISDTTVQDALVDITMLLKLGTLMGFNVDKGNEVLLSNLYDFETQTSISEKDPTNVLTEYFTAMATSSSEIGTFIPETLWGGMDSLRLDAKFLQQRIYVMAASKNKDNTVVSYYQPQMVKNRVTKISAATGTYNQVSVAEWLQLMRTDLEDSRTPIVIHHTTVNQHYSAVLLHREQPPEPTRKQTDLRALYGGQDVSLDRLIERKKNSHKPPPTEEYNDDGPTRLELLASQSDIDLTTAIGALGQRNWNRKEKKAAIDCIATDPSRIREFLGFCGAESSDDAGSEQSEGIPLETPEAADSGSAYDPSSEDDEPEEAGYAFPTPTQDEYAQWARNKWEEVQREWREQDGSKLPALTQANSLAAFAATKPEEMASAAQLFANPFVFLEHLTDDGILAWMSHRWLRHCLTAIGAALETAPVNPVITDLRTWLETTREIPTHAARLRNFQKAAMWTKLRRALPMLFAASTGVPFLAKTLTQEGAYVFAIEAVLPTLARSLAQEAMLDQSSTTGLAYVYRDFPAFKKALDDAIEAEAWAPVQLFLADWQARMSSPARRC